VGLLYCHTVGKIEDENNSASTNLTGDKNGGIEISVAMQKSIQSVEIVNTSDFNKRSESASSDSEVFTL
jgi:hypothetical protein